MVISVEILLLIVLGGITLLAYMIAINSHGATRLSISYLIATVILGGSVWATVQYVNSGINQKNMQEVARLEADKQRAEDQMRSKEMEYSSAMKENKERMAIATRLNSVVTSATTLATFMVNTDLRDMSTDLDNLVARSVDTKRKCDALLADYEKTKITDSFFQESSALVHDGLKLVAEAAQYYYLYFKAEDSAQEEIRERIMRQKARNAGEVLQRANAMITQISSQ